MSLLHRKWRGNPAGKYAAGVLAAGVVLAFAGCGGNGEAPTDEAVPEFVLTYAENPVSYTHLDPAESETDGGG